jgi:hypothetical protein
MEYKAKRGSEYLDFQKAFEGRRDALWKAS